MVAGLDVTVGVLGGPASTANDSFTLVRDIKRHGGRVAFGRRIKDADDPLFTELPGPWPTTPSAPTTPAGHHGCLEAAGIAPSCSLDDDLVLHTPELIG